MKPHERTAAEREALVDAMLLASQALVGVASRSLAGFTEEVTLAQYRVLVQASRGSQRGADLARALGVNPSTESRMCERLVRKGLLKRRRASDDRRTVHLSLTRAGRHLVTEVSRRRRAEVAAIVDRLSAPDHEATVTALRAFAHAAGESLEQHWAHGWNVGDGREEGTGDEH